MLNSKQRAYLQKLSHPIETIIHVGKSGITPTLTQSVDEALEKRELIKMDVLNNCIMDAQEVADIIHERTHSEVVRVIGNKIILFRQNRQKPVITLPK